MQNLVKRDEELDLLKAFSIFWVVVIHCIYWPNIIDQGIGVSMLLFEMPLIFFLIGASNTYAKKRTVRSFYFKRLTRVIYPYELYAIAVIIFTAITGSLKSDIPFGTFAASWINPMGEHLSYNKFLSWHLWFIGTYIILILLMPFFMKLHNIKMTKYLMILFPVILFVLDRTDILSTDPKLAENIRNLVFYGFWTIVGFYFLDLKIMRMKSDFIVPIYTITLGALLGIFYMFISDFIINKQMDFNMQNAKFPPSFLFFCYSLIIMSVLFIVSPILIKGMRSLSEFRLFEMIIHSYNHNGFTIYLTHPFIFLAVFNLFNEYYKDSDKVPVFILFVALTTILSPLLGIVIAMIRKKFLEYMKLISKY